PSARPDADQPARVCALRRAASALLPWLLVPKRARGHRGLSTLRRRKRRRGAGGASAALRRRGIPRRVRDSDRGEVAADRSLEAAADPALEPRVRPLLDRQDTDPLEPRALSLHRLAAVRTLPESAGRENRARSADPVAAHPRVHRSALERCGNSDPQIGELRLLPRPS